MLIKLSVSSAQLMMLASESVFSDREGHSMDVSALSITPRRVGSPYSKEIALGFWGSNTVVVASLPDLEELDRISTSSLPRSLILHCFREDRSSEHPFLLVGLSNGSVMTFALYDDGEKQKLGEGRIVSLGDSPISLNRCTLDNQTVVFAAGTRSAVFFWARDTLNHSSVLVKVCLVSAQIPS